MFIYDIRNIAITIYFFHEYSIANGIAITIRISSNLDINFFFILPRACTDMINETIWFITFRNQTKNVS